jgi:hypothetical protein
MNEEIVKCWNVFPSEKNEIWVQYYIKFSSNWEWGTGSKFIFAVVGGGGNLFTSVTGKGSPVYVTTQTFATNSFPPNVKTVPMYAGKWYKHTLHLVMNTPGVQDGTIQLWVNDTLTTNYSNAGFRSTSQSDRGFSEITANFGIARVNKPAADSAYFDYTIISDEAIGGALPPDTRRPSPR